MAGKKIRFSVPICSITAMISDNFANKPVWNSWNKPVRNFCDDLQSVSRHHGGIILGPWNPSYTYRNLHTETYFRNRIKSNRNLIVFLPCTDWFGIKRTLSLRFQINLKMVNTIWFRFDLARFWTHFSVCRRVLMSRPI